MPVLTERQVSVLANLHPDTLRHWRADKSGGPYWVDLANPGRNQATAHFPTPRKPIIRYPQDRLEAWLRGDVAAV